MNQPGIYWWLPIRLERITVERFEQSVGSLAAGCSQEKSSVTVVPLPPEGVKDTKTKTFCQMNFTYCMRKKTCGEVDSMAINSQMNIAFAAFGILPFLHVVCSGLK